MREKRRGGFRKFLVPAILLVLAWAALATFRIGPEPKIEIESALPGIGRSTPVQVGVSEPTRGLSSVAVDFVQGDRTERLAEELYTPRKPWEFFWGARTGETQIETVVGRDTIERLQGGDATLRVTAERAGTWLRTPEPVVRELTLPVRLTPPAVNVVSDQHYVNQGGAEVVVYQVGESAVEDGVRAGEHWFPGYALPGGTERDRFALFAAPWDLEDSQKIVLVAEDDVGNRAEVTFIDRFSPKPIATDDIRLSDGFLSKVVPEVMIQTPDLSDRGGLLENYLAINGELRAANVATLRGLAKKSTEKFLWEEAFLPMRNAQVMSNFADRRTYVYDGREVDQQTHLGFDLASVKRAEVQAANRGIVLLARYLGIYGNAVVLDHGYGLTTIYGHLSSIAVEEGQVVQRGDAVGRSGETGLAGGDHLHFEVQLGGLAVNPIEWWDDHWVRDRLRRKLGAALSAK